MIKKTASKNLKVPNLRFPEFEGEWEMKSIGEIADLFKGRGISKDQLTDYGIPCILYGELYTKYKSEVIQEVYSKTSINTSGLICSKANDVIIPSSGESTIDISTACCVMLDNVLLGGDLNIIRPNKDNGSFISYQLNGKRKRDIATLAQGSSIIHLYNDSLKNLKIFLPKEIEEQKKIVDLLSFLDVRIQAQKKIIEELRTLKNGLSKRIFTRQLRFPEFTQEWEVVILGKVCEIIGGGTPETNKSEYWNGDIQWFTPTEIKTNFVSESERTITESGLKNSSAKILPKGAILLTTRATIGEAAIALEECTTNQGFQSLIVKEGFNNIFVFNWIKENKYELIKRANGSTFPEVSKSEIEKIEMQIPTLKEQTKIASLLSNIDEKLEVESAIEKLLTKQKQYLLQNLFI